MDAESQAAASAGVLEAECEGLMGTTMGCGDVIDVDLALAFTVLPEGLLRVVTSEHNKDGELSRKATEQGLKPHRAPAPTRKCLLGRKDLLPSAPNAELGLGGSMTAQFRPLELDYFHVKPKAHILKSTSFLADL